MSDFNKKEIEHLAELARMHLDKGEGKSLGKDVDAILGYVGKLSKLDVSNISPTTHSAELSNVMRNDDASKLRKKAENLIEQFPLLEKGYLKVKSVFHHE
ncbi:Asp-tRNA(Asn)/Glu-tRNA(Gln) amidotransferase subunit GatC [Patescibacteria group bacterium]